MMYIKVGDNYFKEFKSIKRGSGSQHFTTHEILEVMLTKTPNEISTLSCANVIKELIELMRFGDIKKEKIEVVWNVHKG